VIPALVSRAGSEKNVYLRPTLERKWNISGSSTEKLREFGQLCQRVSSACLPCISPKGKDVPKL
jgi:hypothetical protein